MLRSVLMGVVVLEIYFRPWSFLSQLGEMTIISDLASSFSLVSSVAPSLELGLSKSLVGAKLLDCARPIMLLGFLRHFPGSMSPSRRTLDSPPSFVGYSIVVRISLVHNLCPESRVFEDNFMNIPCLFLRLNCLLPISRVVHFTSLDSSSSITSLFGDEANQVEVSSSSRGDDVNFEDVLEIVEHLSIAYPKEVPKKANNGPQISTPKKSSSSV
ncbi:unnamed protein product, partial [Ilex paraguariensis]